MKTTHKLLTVATLVTSFVVLAGAAGAAGDSIADAQTTLTAFKRTDPSLNAVLERSAGYAVFPSVGKGGLGIGGAHGSGILFDATGKALGTVKLNQVSVGAQAGGQSFSELLIFETPAALADFQKGEFSLAAQVSAVALKSGASANARFENGVAVFTATKGGLMYEAAVGGQKFKFHPMK